MERRGEVLAEISHTVKDFIDEYIDSVDSLDILLLLRGSPEDTWGPSAISRALHLDAALVAPRLDHLRSAGLIQERTVATDCVYQYAPSSPDVALAIDELATAFATFRVRIVEQIFSKPLKKIQTFQDPESL